MQIVFTARDVQISPSVQDYIEKKAAKLTRYYDQIQAIRVVASIKDKQARVEIQVDVEHGQDLVSHVSSSDFMVSADQVVDKLAAQLGKLKSKVQDHQREPLKTASTGRTDQKA